MKSEPTFSLSLEIPPASPDNSYLYFMNKLSYETDVADLSID